MVSAFGSSLGRPCRIPCNHHRSGLVRGWRRNRLPYESFLVVRRSSDDLSAIFDGRRGCCEEEDGQLQRREKMKLNLLPEFNHRCDQSDPHLHLCRLNRMTKEALSYLSIDYIEDAADVSERCF